MEFNLSHLAIIGLLLSLWIKLITNDTDILIEKSMTLKIKPLIITP